LKPFRTVIMDAFQRSEATCEGMRLSKRLAEATSRWLAFIVWGGQKWIASD